MINLEDLEDELVPLTVKLGPKKEIKIEYRPQVYTSGYLTGMTGRDIHEVIPELVASWDLKWRPVMEVPADEPIPEQCKGWEDLGVYGKVVQEAKAATETEAEELEVKEVLRRLRSPDSEVAPITPSWIEQHLGLRIANTILRTMTNDQVPNLK